MALQYVFYPKFAGDGPARAFASAKRLLPKVGMLSAAGLVPLWVAAGWAIPTFYGPRFDAAVLPTRIILVGLMLDGVAGLIGGFFYGVGRPGLNSCAMAVGLAVTVVLDVLLIPSHAATGAAIASAVAYTVTGLALIWFFWRLQARRTAGPPRARRMAAATADEGIG
jgi:O-antigen/teichoic acid export membrane protein